jgi:hypothetical protein
MARIGTTTDSQSQLPNRAYGGKAGGSQGRWGWNRWKQGDVTAFNDDSRWNNHLFIVPSYTWGPEKSTAGQICGGGEAWKSRVVQICGGLGKVTEARRRSMGRDGGEDYLNIPWSELCRRQRGRLQPRWWRWGAQPREHPSRGSYTYCTTGGVLLSLPALEWAPEQGGKRPGEARDISGDSSVEGRVGWRRGSAALVARSRKKRRNKRETRHLTNNTTESFSLVVVRFVCWGNVWIRSTYSFFIFFILHSVCAFCKHALFFLPRKKMCIL